MRGRTVTGPISSVGAAATDTDIGPCEQIARLGQTRKHLHEVEIQDLGDLRVWKTCHRGEKQDFAKVERQSVKPDDVFWQERQRRSGIAFCLCHRSTVSQTVQTDQGRETPDRNRQALPRQV